MTDLIYLLSHDGNVIPKKLIAANAILCDGAANLLINQPLLIGLVSPTPPAVRLNVIVVYMSPTQRSQPGAVGTRSGPLGPSEDLRGPQTGLFGPLGVL